MVRFATEAGAEVLATGTDAAQPSLPFDRGEREEILFEGEDERGVDEGERDALVRSAEACSEAGQIGV